MKTRVISALIAASLFLAIYVFFESNGLLFICAVVAAGCLREYGRLAFQTLQAPRYVRILFYFLSMLTYVNVFLNDTSGLVSVVICTVVFLTATVMSVKSVAELEGVLKMQGLGLLGLLYVGVMPALATRLLDLPKGDRWLFCLLAIVFAGDTMAYLTGRKWGKTRLLEPVSPKKSIEGAVGGLIGSGLIGWALSYVLPHSTPMLLICIAVLTGIFAQVGDLFESLLKRVANVKDSGTIMPGHGGLLDRCDGVYFAAPVFYVLVRFLTRP